MQKVLHKLGNIMLILIMITSLLVLVSVVTADREKDKPPSIFGFSFLIVLTGSMEPQISVGDLTIIKKIPFEKVLEEDVVTFRMNNSQTFVTHRVERIVDNSALETKGDANNVIDDELVTEEQLVGKVMFIVPKAGYILNVIKNPYTIAVLISIGVAIIVTNFARVIFRKRIAQER
ncbi:signal peptidase I [Sutcliffiella cohnii]|uniref:Signal peptidase I n=1 Tax=Sutcliffiella cohnii TaxID=33932 RepID=A0A223KVM9_9BACI|nr:signal peptidase I [Sutcliffiella cohnii]AST93525.1 signal peptidase I [Sutcliffiella cohnii]